MAVPGFCVWLTGLSGSGKSTIAGALQSQLRRLGLGATVFDGDAVRARLSSDLGFSRPDRNANVLRVAANAAETVNASGIAICALMSPYEEARQKAREIVGASRFVLIYVATPLTVCENRDVKGLYARARRGEISHFVGIDEEYEQPVAADLRLDTSATSVEAEVQMIVDLLSARFQLLC
jgi:adenylyl-sulfate kinase